MIKHILPLIAGILLNIALPAVAQTRSNPLTEARDHRWDLPLSGGAAGKNSGITGSRLVKSAWGPFANGGFLFKDSSNYRYLPTMGMHPILGWMFDTMTTVTRYPNITRNSVRSLHTFNSSGYITDLEVQWWDSVNNTWFGVSRLKHDYSGTTLLASTQSNFVNSTWTPVTKTEYYTNTVTGARTTLLQQWNATTGKFEYLQREVTKYNSFGVDSILKENYSGSSWVPEKITAYTYNNGKATLIERTIKSGATWVPDYKETNSYNSNGQLTETIFETYNHLSGMWNDPMKEEYSYDTDGNRTETIASNWISGAYKRSSRETISYNSYKQVLVSTSQTWDNNFSNWYYSSNDAQYRYYYEEYTTGVKHLAKNEMDIKVYPVPASDILHMELTGNNKISIVDMQGRLVKYLPLSDTQNRVTDIQVSDLVSGIYLLKVESDYGTAIRRLSIAR